MPCLSRQWLQQHPHYNTRTVTTCCQGHSSDSLGCSQATNTRATNSSPRLELTGQAELCPSDGQHDHRTLPLSDGQHDNRTLPLSDGQVTTELCPCQTGRVTTELCPCQTGSMTTEHVLQVGPLQGNLRRQLWPVALNWSSVWTTCSARQPRFKATVSFHLYLSLIHI